MGIRRPNQVEVILFLLPCLTIWSVNLVGELMLSDIAVALLAPLLLLNRNINIKQPYLLQIILLLVLWLIGAYISDIVNDSSMKNILRGSASIIFFGLHIFVFFVLIDGQRQRYVPAVLGLAVSFLLLWTTGNSAFSSLDLTDTPWRMGAGFAVTILFMSVLGLIVQSNRVQGKILLILAPIHLYFNARSLFLTTVLAGAVSAFQLRVTSHKMRRRIIIGVLASVIVGLPIATSVYGKLNEAGIFGEEAKLKYLQQTAGGKINIILAGRSESLISFRAITDAPLLGHGSWAESMHYYNMYLSRLEALGRDVNWAAMDYKHGFLIPTHSMLFGSWVFHGILAAVFWLYILVLTVKALGYLISGFKPIQPLELLILFTLLWDIFFSPFGQARRCIVAIYIVVACTILVDNNRKNEP